MIVLQFLTCVSQPTCEVGEQTQTKNGLEIARRPLQKAMPQETFHNNATNIWFMSVNSKIFSF